MATPSMATVSGAVNEIAASFAADAAARSRRTALDAKDFAGLFEAGFLLTGMPVQAGGLWGGIRESVRHYANMVRMLGRADPSVALVAAMHPSVLAFWLAALDDGHWDDALRKQAQRNFERAAAGHWWGTVISEPGSGGDPNRTTSTAIA
ncbi:MAG: acyl-CoA/acyl-ACP dehydrogenase, partial [Gammaproteobacteria bacterium]|nr:acyl-CoA/acyl-ACP dehydrogenase [Gammaproteobacteria bacterium]